MSNLPALYVTVYFSIILACAITVINCRYRGTVLNDVFNTMNITKSGYFKMVLRCVVFYTPFLNKIAVAYICDLILKDKNHARFLLAVGTRIIVLFFLFLIPSAIKYNLIVIYIIFVLVFALCIALNIHCSITLLSFVKCEHVYVTLFSNIFSPITISKALYVKVCDAQKRCDFELD